MRTFIQDYIINVLVALAVLLIGSYLLNAGQRAYYTHAPIEWFYVSGGMVAEDVCLGDTSQTIVSTRTIYGTDTGYPATVVRELLLVERGIQTKVHDEVAMPFVEQTTNGVTRRKQQLPSWLTVGQYQWFLNVTLTINGVVRNDIDTIESNVFQVTNCDV